MKYTIFSIDKWYEVHQIAKFLRHVDTLSALQKLQGRVIPCVGSYEGVLEVSYICRSDDFDTHILNSGYVSGQESFVRLSECNKQYAELEYQHTGVRKSLGSLKSVDKDTAMKETAWTYRPDLNTYWITVKGNPDTVHGDPL